MQVIIKVVILVPQINSRRQTYTQAFKQPHKQTIQMFYINAYDEFWCMVLENILFKSGFAGNKLIKVLICYKVLKSLNF
jgi:hypothetical protein